MNSPISLAAGTVLSSRFELVRELGTGGTATVWEVQDQRLGVRRALKILLTRRASRREALRRRLRAEASAMAQLAHPNVLSIHDVGSSGELDYVVMDLAEGGSLSEWLDRTGPMDPHTALSFVVQVLSALAAAHASGIVHRDVKPQNVLLNSRGTALLADFGIALLTVDAHRTTRTGVAMGSLSFMAPEQRLDARSVAASADIYATGAMLYNLLTGANPVDLFTVEQGSARLQGLPQELQQILLRATRHSASERYESAQAMAREIVRFLPDAGDDPYRVSTSNPETFPAPSQSLMTGGPVHTPTIGPEGANPTLMPLNEDATREAITFLGDDFELFAARLVAKADAAPRGAGLTQVPMPNLPETGLIDDSPASPKRPVWVLLPVLLIAGLGIWWWSQDPQPSSGGLPAVSSASAPAEPRPQTPTSEPTQETSEPAVVELTPELETEPQPSPAPSSTTAQPKVIAEPSERSAPPPEPPKAPQGSGPPFGRWQLNGTSGNLGYIELTVQGSADKVRGTWESFAGPGSSTVLVGSFDPNSGRLSLRTKDGRALRLTLYLQGPGLQGEYSRTTPTGEQGGHIDFTPVKL